MRNSNMQREKIRFAMQRRTRRWQLYMMILPALTFLILFAYKPMYGIVISFQDYNLWKGISGSEWVGLRNFERLFHSYWFPVIVKNTLTISLLSLAIGFPMPVILALMTNEIGSQKIKGCFQAISYAPHFVSTIVVCGMVILFLNPTSGIINRLIVAVGGTETFFMQKPGMFKWIYVLSGVWQNTGWSAIIYVAALSGLDKQLLEAADIDGASRFQKICYINFPVLVPTIVILFILQCGSIMNVGYEKVYALQNSTNLQGSEVISTYVYKIGLEKQDFAFSTAVGLLYSVVNSVVLILANTISRQVGQTGLW